MTYNVIRSSRGVIDSATPRISELRLRERLLEQDKLLHAVTEGVKNDKHSPACNQEGEHGSLFLLSYRHFAVLKAMAEK